jgi:hypothetical protein
VNGTFVETPVATSRQKINAVPMVMASLSLPQHTNKTLTEAHTTLLQVDITKELGLVGLSAGWLATRYVCMYVCMYVWMDVLITWVGGLVCGLAGD